ncbi:response regulator [Paenibacillus sp. N3.4]|uniref:hybrid sensor histidine kinase/response regulator n=1 Tax=Paenibacillus sp. N3.4 TaxID=2603222 RepID=UPI0011C77C8E|nr:response regulator [Paenibacillus sp. N3.4]
MEGSVQIPQLLIGLVAISGTGIIFSKTRSYWLKWLYGEAFFFIFYYSMIWLIYGTSLSVIWKYIGYQSICVFFIACFLRYLVRNREYKQKIHQVEREMIDMLRLQPGFTFKLHKYRDQYTYILIEGQLLHELGLRPSQFIGKSMNEITVISKQHAELLQQHYDKAWEGERVTYESDFTGRSLHVTLQPIYKYGSVNEVIGSVLDMTEHIAAQSKARVRDEQYRTLVENSEDFIFRFRLDGSISSANQKFCRTYQLTFEQVRGRRFTDVVWLEEPESWQEAFGLTINRQKTQKFELNLQSPEGSDHVYNVTLSPLFNEEKTDITGVTGTIHDITDIKKRKEADEANRAKSQFLARMSHEIRTPLNGIIGLTSLLQRTDVTETQKEYLNKIGSSSTILLATINDILDFSKIEADKIVMENVDFSLASSLQRVADLASVSVGRKQLDIMLDTSEDLPTLVNGDPFRLEQVLINLANNAIKFTEQGYFLIKVQLEEYVDEGVVVSFRLEDTGIGISEEQMSHLFRPFTQADTSTSRKYGGTGLGLVICQNLVHAMGGDLQVDSTLGQGTRFYFSLMFGRVGLVGQETHPSPDVLRLLQGNNRALLVEDHPVVGQHLMELLSSFGLQVDMVSSLSQLFSRIESQSESENIAGPNYVFLDMQMEQINELPSWNRLMSSLDRTFTKVIAFTTLACREEALQFPKELRADVVLTKPISRLTLQHAIQALQQDAQGLTEAVEMEITSSMKPTVPSGSLGYVLVAEDNDINQLVITSLLERLGYQPIIAQNGCEVLEVYNQHPWELIFMDLHMPVMDGYETTKKLRQHKSMNSIPIIALTANVLMQDQAEALKLGLNDILIKPVDEKQLSDMIAKWKDLNLFYEIEGLDTRKVLQNIDGKIHIFQYMMVKFKLDYGEFAKLAASLIEKQDMVIVRRMVHTLKGIAANFYAQSLLAAVRVLEEELGSDTQHDLHNEQLIRIQSEIDRILRSMSF